MKISILKSVPLLFILICCQGENIHREYKELNAAITAGEQLRGWLPPFFPKSSINIKIYNNVDTNTGSGIFDFSPAERLVYTEEIRSKFAAKVTESENSTRVNFKYQKSHWHLELPKSGKKATWTLDSSLE